MAVLEPTLAILDETDSGLDIDALRVVSEGVNALRSPERAVHRRHPLPAPARLHRARLRARAERRPHRALGRHGAGARARREGLRLDRGGAGGSPPVTTPAGASTGCAPARLRSARARRSGSRRIGATRWRRSSRGLPDDAPGGLALHQRGADRGHARSRWRRPRPTTPRRSCRRTSCATARPRAVVRQRLLRRDAVVVGALPLGVVVQAWPRASTTDDSSARDLGRGLRPGRPSVRRAEHRVPRGRRARASCPRARCSTAPIHVLVVTLPRRRAGDGAPARS